MKKCYTVRRNEEGNLKAATAKKNILPTKKKIAPKETVKKGKK